MGQEAEFLLRNVDTQAIREFRKVAKEAHEAQEEGRDDGPQIPLTLMHFETRTFARCRSQSSDLSAIGV